MEKINNETSTLKDNSSSQKVKKRKLGEEVSAISETQFGDNSVSNVSFTIDLEPNSQSVKRRKNDKKVRKDVDPKKHKVIDCGTVNAHSS